MACFAEFNEEGVIMEIKGYSALWRNLYYKRELDLLCSHCTCSHCTLRFIDLFKGVEDGGLIVIQPMSTVDGSEEIIGITRFILKEDENQLTLNFEESEGEKE